MKITFDDVKRERSLTEKGLDFLRAGEVFEGATVTANDARKDYGEARFVTAGRLDGRIVVVVWTPRGQARRIISMRKANEREIKNTPKPWVDPDDAPELTDEFFEQGIWRIGDRVVSREEARAEDAKRRGRPVGVGTKISTTIRFDADVLAAFKAQGDGWQTRMNDALKEWLKSH